jgi:bacterioferritin (cytochrome b1)
MQGSPEVIEALNGAYRLAITIEQQAHMQEHVLEAQGWKRLSDWFDAIEENGHEKLIHPLMKRINALGGSVDYQYAFEPETYGFEDIESALASMARRLGQLHRAYIAVCDAADPADDYVTEKMAWEHQAWIEKKQLKFDRRLAKLRSLGREPFLAEMMDD